METKEMRVAAFMTASRYVSKNCDDIIHHALAKLKIPLSSSGGVFYGQCMQRMLEDAIAKDIEFALTIDGDSVFTPDQVMRLFSVMASEESIDALASLQSRRSRSNPLFVPEVFQDLPDGKTGIVCDGTPFKCRTAHFGLTVIRLARLKDVPKPWFWSKPNENGEWTGNKIDDDIWFWKQWEEAGRTLYVDSECSIWHMEEMFSCYDENMNHQFVYPSDWAAEYMK